MKYASVLVAVLLVFASFLPVCQADEQRVIVAPPVYILKALAKNPPWYLRANLMDADGFAGTLRMDKELNADELLELEKLGVRFSRLSALPTHWDVDHLGPIYPTRIPWASLDNLMTFPRLVQVESEYLLKPVQPLDTTVPQTGAPEYIDYIEKLSEVRPGEGIRIADIDSGIDVFHPSFFYPDGGYFDWIDVDQDGLLTLNVDACDLNRNGQADGDEIIRYHDVVLVNMYNHEGVNISDMTDSLKPNGVYDPDVDWLYVDLNNNENRGFGQEAGFDDSSPGFGEPVILVDDVDGNGLLDPIERMVMLGTSKIRKALVGGKDYIAGQNLSELTFDVFPPSSSGVPTAMHGTGVAGILAANTPRLNRFVGMAPFAELYMIDSSKDGSQPGAIDGTVPKLVWAKEQKVDIVLFEFSSWGMTFMDGTSNLEKAIDQLHTKNDILQVVPAGNLADSGKHMLAELPPGQSLLPISIPEQWEGYDYYPFETPMYVLSLYWHGSPDDLELETKLPEGGGYVHLPVDQYQPKSLGSNMSAASQASMSMAGFVHRLNYIVDSNEKAIMQGTWTWRINNKTGDKLIVQGYLQDYVSSWGRGVEFAKWESAETTICHPSTADYAISVAAYAGVNGTADELGKVRDYSSRGPRMDGFQAIDIIAPDDPYTPLARMKTGMMMGLLDIKAAYTVFGGTSGAGPHVAASLALMKQLDPEASSAILYDRLIKNTVTESFMGALPNKEYGYGKLNVYKTHFHSSPPGNLPPTANAELYFRNGFYVTLDGSGSIDPESGPLQFRWDLDYDGTWDSTWLDNPELEYGYSAEGTYTAKMMVRDEHGARDFALLQFEVFDDYIPNKPKPSQEEDLLEQPPLDNHSPDTIEESDGGAGKAKKKGGCSTGSAPLSGLPLILGVYCALIFLLRIRHARPSAHRKI